MDELTISWLYQYLDRVVGDYEIQLQHLYHRYLLSCDTVDLIDYIELRQRYLQALDMQQDICKILSIGRRVVPREK